MPDLPRDVDWRGVLDNLKARTGLRQSGICRVAGVGSHILTDAINRGNDPRYSKVAPILALHMKLLPDVPIPEKKR